MVKMDYICEMLKVFGDVTSNNNKSLSKEVIKIKCNIPIEWLRARKKGECNQIFMWQSEGNFDYTSVEENTSTTNLVKS